MQNYLLMNFIMYLGMTVLLNLDLIMNNLIESLGTSVYFILITSENGAVIKSYINEEEFNKASISLNISQLYELAEETAESIGLHSPDFNIIHSENYFILSMKILENIIILLTVDQIEVKDVFEIINKSITMNE
jgi:predicted regulator of Ras-like GTPase activity (Roadblock/LC7/MglB family)